MIALALLTVAASATVAGIVTVADLAITLLGRIFKGKEATAGK